MPLAELGAWEREEEVRYSPLLYNLLCIWEVIYSFIQRFIIMVGNREPGKVFDEWK